MTLTLPGIAGMILTIGVAADANVVIFERIKEEVRRGKTVRSAVNSGYARGFKTILDANVLTVLTALVLFLFATAGPKGFAFTLIIGVIVSMLTAVLFTRAMLGVLAGFAFFNKPSFMGVKAGQVDIETAVMGDTRAAASRKRARRRRATPLRRRRPSPPRPAARRRRPRAPRRRPPHVDLQSQAQEAEIAGELLPPHLLVRLHGPQVLVVHHLRHHHRRRPHQPVRQGRRQPGRRASTTASSSRRARASPWPSSRRRALAEVRQVVASAGYADAQIQQTGNIANTGQAGFQIQTTRPQRGSSRPRCKTALDQKFKIAPDGWTLEPPDGERLLRQAGHQLVAQGRRHSPCS